MKRLLLALAVGVLVADLVHAAPAAAQKTGAEQVSIAQRLCSAGRVRQQAQRIAKLYLQIGMSLNADAARKQLATASVQLDNDLSELSLYSKNDRTRPTLERLSEVWADMKLTIAKPYGVERRNLVNYLAEDLSIASGKLAMQIERDAETPTGRLLDLSLRQSMLVQRLARLYLMAQAGDPSYGLQVDIGQTQKEFSTALNELLVARDNSKASREALELAKMQWIFFEQAIDGLNNGHGSKPRNVATTSERILEALDSVSAQYAQDSTLSVGKSDPQLALNGGRTRRN